MQLRLLLLAQGALVAQALRLPRLMRYGGLKGGPAQNPLGSTSNYMDLVEEASKDNSLTPAKGKGQVPLPVDVKDVGKETKADEPAAKAPSTAKEVAKPAAKAPPALKESEPQAALPQMRNGKKEDKLPAAEAQNALAPSQAPEGKEATVAAKAAEPEKAATAAKSEEPAVATPATSPLAKSSASPAKALDRNGKVEPPAAKEAKEAPLAEMAQAAKIESKKDATATEAPSASKKDSLKMSESAIQETPKAAVPKPTNDKDAKAAEAAAKLNDMAAAAAMIPAPRIEPRPDAKEETGAKVDALSATTQTAEATPSPPAAVTITRRAARAAAQVERKERRETQRIQTKALKEEKRSAAKALKEEKREAAQAARAQKISLRKERKAAKKTAAKEPVVKGEGFQGDSLEEGWEKRGARSSFRRNIEIWGFGLKSALRVFKANKSGDSAKKTEAAEHVRDGLLRLGPTFVKLGQVISTRTDVLSEEFIAVLKTLQDDVPAFSGKRAVAIVEAELGKPIPEVFSSFDATPLAAASLGQVHRGTLLDGREVIVKVQRAGLKELFDVDLKNLKKLAKFLDKIDPKSDGADRDWAAIYDESERLLYQEIDYLNEASNARRFKEDFADFSWVKVPDCYLEHTTRRVLTQEYVPSFKLTDVERVEAEGLDKALLATRTADSFLRQIVVTGFFHSDPHPGNLAVNKEGQLVYYDFGMMGVLKPRVQDGFREFCTALFEGGPIISEIDLARNAKRLVAGVEQMGVLAKGADRLAVEKFARFFMRSFKDTQLGKPTANLKKTLGSDLRTLTDDKGGTVFRFPSTFTFIFRAFASIDGIGKGLDPKYDISKLSQPFIEDFINEAKEREAGGAIQRQFEILGKATGLNGDDINTAVSSPRKIRYLEETLRSMEEGTLKIRVRALENEAALDRLTMQVGTLQNLLCASVLMSTGLAIPAMVPTILCYTAAAGCATGAASSALSIKIFDKKQKRYTQKAFLEDEEGEEA